MASATFRSLRRNAGFTRLWPLLLAVVLPAAAPRRAAAAGDSGELADYLCEEIKKPAFRKETSPSGEAVLVPNRRGMAEASFVMPKRPGVRRVFVLGESAAGLLGGSGLGGARIFPALLRPGQDLEIINAGMGAYDSARILPVFLEVLDYAPDLLILLSGNNERTTRVADPCQGALPGADRVGNTLREKVGGLLGEEFPQIAASLSAHEDRLSEMTGLAAKRGVPLIMCTLPSNARDLPPSGKPPMRDPLYEQAAADLEEGRYAEAAEGFGRYAAAAPRDAFGAFYRAKALDRQGRIREAAGFYRLALEMDPQQDRCSGERNEMIRRTAAAAHACLADLERDFAAASSGGVTGGEAVIDGVHWHPQFTPFAWSRIWTAAAACPAAAGRLFGSKPPSPEEFRTGVVKDGAFAPALRGAGEKAGLRLLYAVSFLLRQDMRERAIALLGALEGENRGLLVRALDSEKYLKENFPDNMWSRGTLDNTKTWRPALLAVAAEMWRRRAEYLLAEKYAGESLRLAPADAEVHLILGLALAARGRKKAARASFLAALENGADPARVRLLCGLRGREVRLEPGGAAAAQKPSVIDSPSPED